jgi:hypothetical protein
MKALCSVTIALILCSFLFSGCKQVLKSVEETFNPDDAAVNRQSQKPKQNADTYTMQIVQQQMSISITTETHTSTTTEHHTSTSTHPPVGRVSKKFLTDTSRLKRAEKALRALPQFAGKEIFIYRSVHFYEDGSIMLMLRHPENPMYADNYWYRDGKWSAPKPAQVSVHDDIGSKLVSLDKVRFASVAKVAQVYNGKAAEVEGAKPATVVYVSIWDNRMRWFPGTINGTRERYDIQFNEDGSLKSFRQE